MTGIRRALPEARLLKAPLTDRRQRSPGRWPASTGGSCTPHRDGSAGPACRVPLRLLGGAGPRTAVLEMAAAAGLCLSCQPARNLMATTTRGVGGLIRAPRSTRRGTAAHRLRATRQPTRRQGVWPAGAGGPPAERGGDRDRAEEERRWSSTASTSRAGTPASSRMDEVSATGATSSAVLAAWRACSARRRAPRREMVARLEAALERYAAIIARDVAWT